MKMWMADTTIYLYCHHCPDMGLMELADTVIQKQISGEFWSPLQARFIVGLLLGQRRRLWLNIKPALGLVFSGLGMHYVTCLHAYSQLDLSLLT